MSSPNQKKTSNNSVNLDNVKASDLADSGMVYDNPLNSDDLALDPVLNGSEHHFSLDPALRTSTHDCPLDPALGGLEADFPLDPALRNFIHDFPPDPALRSSTREFPLDPAFCGPEPSNPPVPYLRSPVSNSPALNPALRSLPPDDPTSTRLRTGSPITPQVAVLRSMKTRSQEYNLASPTAITDQELLAIIQNTKYYAAEDEAGILEQILESCIQADSVALAFREVLKKWCLGMTDGVDLNTLDEEVGKCAALVRDTRVRELGRR